jgi:UDP:flavonoid glycosyltransferase YjiC (YdhE family)
MSRIVFAWQLGANYGHLMTDLPIAECLRSLGHDVSFVVADEQIAAQVLSPANFRFIPSPRRPRPSTATPALASYAEIMEESGFGDDESLSSLVHEWSILLESTRAEVIVADHAPVAVLAARFLNKPTVILGTGFTVPPPVTPFPLIRPWETIEPGRLQRAENRVLGRINSLSARRGFPALTHLFELFAARATLLTTFPELDPFGPRLRGTYVGPITSESMSTPVQWTADSRHRVLAYLRPSVPKLAAVLTALEESQAQVICVVPDATAELQQHFAGTSVRLLSHPVPLNTLLRSADLVVSYGGAGLTAASLTTGVPMLLVPQNAEQVLGSMQVVKRGAGVLIGPREGDLDVAPALARMLSDDSFKAAAQRFQRQYAAFDGHAASGIAASMIAACAK